MIEYDSSGRMKYNPEFHTKSGQPWEEDDIQYLIDWYEKIGPEEMSFALERPISAIIQKATVLRKKGFIKKPTKEVRFARARYENERNMMRG